MNDDWLTIGFGVGVGAVCRHPPVSASCVRPLPARRKVLTMNRKTVAGQYRHE